MKRSNFFWGLLLIFLGALFLLKQLHLIVDVLSWFFPVAIIVLGVLLLIDRRKVHGTLLPTAETLNIALQNAARVDLDLDHGAGSIFLSGEALPGVALSAVAGAGLEESHELNANGLAIKLQAGPTFIPFLGPQGGEWQFRLTREVPVSIQLEAGASSIEMDLSEMNVPLLRVHMGASYLKARLPKLGRTLVDINCGMANIDLSIPAGTAARVRVQQGASNVHIDRAIFQQLGNDPDLYQSSDFETNPNKVEISLEGGANNITIIPEAGNAAI